MKNNYIKSERMFKVCKRYVLRMFYVISILFTFGVGQMWGTTYTHVVGVAANNTNDYSAKVNVKRVKNDCSDWSDWDQESMTKAGITFEGKKLYIGAYYTCQTGIYNMQFQFYDGSTQKNYYECYAGDAQWNYYNNYIYDYDSHAWYGAKKTDTGARFYFDASTWDETSIKMCVGHANYQKYYSLTLVSNTNLYYGNPGDSWTDAMGVGVVGNTTAAGGAVQLTDVSANANEYTGFKNWDINATGDGNAYLCVPNGKAGQQPTMSYNDSHLTLLNSTQTVKFAVSTNGATPVELSSGTTPAQIRMRSYKFASGTYNAVSAESPSDWTAGSSTYYKTFTAARTATTTLTVSNINDDYTFLGWYTAASGGTLLSSETSYTYYPTAATTVYARFSHENNHSVTISRYCTSTSSEINNTTAKVGEITYAEITAPAISGYTFSNWSYGNGISVKSGDNTSSNPIHVITLSSGTYTLTANYTEDLTTSWKLIGDNQSGSPFGDNYSYASGKEMLKAHGYSTTNKAYKTLNVSKLPADNYGFKVATAAGNSNSYGWGTSDGAYITFNRSKSGNANDVYTGEQHQLKFVPDGLGEYVFEVDYTASPCSVKVTFPTVYTVTYGRGSINGTNGTVTAQYSSTSFSSGTKIQSGKTITLTAPAAKANYTFRGWFNVQTPGANVDPITESHTYSPTISAATTLYACYVETRYVVGARAGSNGSVSPTSVYARVVTASDEVTATPNTGYKFDSWSLPSNVTAASTYTTSSNPIRVNATATSQYLEASFSPRWSAIGTGAFGGWSATGTNLFVNYEVVDGDDEGYYSIDLAANTDYEVKVYDRNTSTTYGGLSAQNVYYATSGADKPFTMATTSSGKSLTIHSAAAGEYWLNWNLTDKALALVYPTSWYITTGQSDAAGGSFTAVDNSSNDVKGGKFVADGATVTFTANKNTGYRFDGWFYNADYDNSHKYVDNNTDINLSGDDNKVLELSSIGANKAAYAKFTAKTYTVTLTRSGTGYGSGGTASITATYNQTLPAATMPTAANGYAFMGYYTSAGGEGSQIINASGVVQTVAGYTDGDKKWIRDADTELFAYFKKAEITNLAVTPGTVETGGTVTATPTISPTPTGDHIVCWRLLQSNDNPVGSQPTFTPGAGNAVTFPAPSVSGSYKVECVLRTGTTCGAGTTLDSVVTSFVVAGTHTVTIRYQDGSGRTLAASTTMTGRPLDWSDAISPATITGYTFVRWNAGDGVSITDDNGVSTKTTTTTASIKVKASYDGNLTAVYSKKRMIYFNNTLGWSGVTVYFYSSDAYWNESNGTGSNTGGAFTGKYGAMTQIEGTNIWYYDCEANSVSSSDEDVVFTEYTQQPYEYFSYKYGTSTPNNVVRRGDYKSSLPMFVPLTGVEGISKNGGKAIYYPQGYWMNYPENTGYVLHVYNGTTYNTSDQLQEIPFVFNEDKTLPMSINVELNASRTYGFEIHRADGTVLGDNSYTMQSGASGDAGQATKTLTTSQRSKITTTVAGDYTFTLSFGNSSGYKYFIGVHYPAAVGDYRVVYTDRVAWSGATHGAGYWHPSRAIHKENGAEDIVSFYVKKDANTNMKFQYASAINASTGAVTWTDVTSGSIDLSGITETGVYNFHLTQANGSISVSSIEPYTGNYYIRTDCAGSTKWENFRTLDHQMTYSDYAAANSGFTHYYAHWVTGGTNVKFVIANDYSLCITDTLVQDYGTVVANIDANGFLASGSANNASIRFMWDYTTNKISRAYISGSTNISDRFLVLEGDAKMFDENGDALSISGLNANEINLVDDENFVYERTIMVYPSARAKLTAKYNSNVQYFKGSEGAFAEGTTVELLGGTYSTETKYSMRIVYDFKTDRLVTAYIPSSEVTGSVSINADLMLIREHQGEGQQLTFANNTSSLNTVKTVYGVMRFNRWILNNRQHPEDHIKEHGDTDAHIAEFHPLVGAGSMKSVYERALYWVSFPFDVNLSDVFGFGTYGTHWILMQYNGAERARIGYWKDNEEGFWEYIWDRQGVTLKAGKGYVLALELDLMAANNSTFWSNGIQQVELFFPSTASAGTISQTTVNVTVPSHECTIDRRTDKSTPDWNNDRRIADSHWNIIGVPSYANYGSTLSNGSSDITWQVNPKADGLPFLYEWNANDNTYTVQSGTKYNFKAMHAYYVQYAGTLRWTLASATPSIVARRTYAEESENVEFKLELTQNDKMIDQTFVKLSNDEEASTNFAFGEDLDKEFNDGKANVYTFIEGYIPSAGNTMPMTDQTTLVPVGVKITKAGEYTFAIPDGTSGVGVTLIDNVANTRTNLSALDYTVNLMAGTIDNRFVLEISPIHNATTGIEQVVGKQDTDVRKVLIDGILYIVKDGKMYDVRGTMIK